MYRIFDQLLDSEIVLPELEPAGSGDPAIRLEVVWRPPRSEPGWEPVHDWVLADGAVAISCARRGAEYLLGFPGAAQFHLAEAGRHITCHPEPGAPATLWRHLLLDQVIPRILGHWGHLVIHASAVAFDDGRAVAFLGDAGWGKSTLAAAFRRRESTPVADDCLLLRCRADRVRGIPAYPGLRLWPDAALATLPAGAGYSRLGQCRGKHRLKPRVPAPGAATRAVELACLFLLTEPAGAAPDGRISLRPVEGADALVALIARLFTLDVRDGGRASANLTGCGEVINTGLPVVRLDYPRVHELLPGVCRAVTAWLDGGPEPAAGAAEPACGPQRNGKIGYTSRSGRAGAGHAGEAENGGVQGGTGD
jgi:hypothetical protein